MAITIVKVNRYECDGCGNVQLGKVTEGVYGIMGTVAEHTPSGGHGAEWFACSQECVSAAVVNALDTAR